MYRGPIYINSVTVYVNAMTYSWNSLLDISGVKDTFLTQKGSYSY